MSCIRFYSSTLPPSQRVFDAYVDEIAELLSTDRFTLPEIASRLGVSGATACVLLRELCLRYGEPVRA